MPEVADAVNTLVRFCARRDVDALTADRLGGRVDVAILFGGSILAGAGVLADVVRRDLAAVTLVVGGRGHSTDALRAALRQRTDWPDLAELSEAALFDRYLREHEGVAVDALEERSTHCGTNVTHALALLDDLGVSRERLLLIQDATMQQRMDAGFRRHVPPSTTLVNFASHRTLVEESGDGLRPVDPPEGMWATERYVSMLRGEVSRLTDDARGYGPAGAGHIAHVEVPADVRRAQELLRARLGGEGRRADPRWAG